ncbi:chemotaxis protein histidine kinase CheA [Pseudarthrobacter siccitolerans]|uniref:Chemotaxis protein histidine kinase CheA n=1 Tax=Pseudarthrobacter siccitolerans TaxID=861266 RepID=A0ABU0PPW1_9MICC|nr:excalibur calcium-binding domain-containing protein [Pseudarthrobacter siccitolerans]MDQ0676018.1 chemotaxis protein histidine kinase CheA [Pseudarthrobacter siccitolerans]
MKKTLALVVLTGLMLTGCGGKQAAVQPTETATAVAAVVETVNVPGVTAVTLDKASDQLEDLGFKVEAVDSVDGKMIVSKKNWQVVTQDPADGAQAAKGSTVHLGVKSLEKLAEEKAAAEKAAAEKAAAEQAAAEKAAAEKAAADKAAADKVAADQAAADQAAAQQAAAAAQAAQQAAKPAPAPAAPVAPAPASAYYGSCADARNAGAAPLYAGQAGYRAALDRDKDGVACE